MARDPMSESYGTGQRPRRYNAPQQPRGRTGRGGGGKGGGKGFTVADSHIAHSSNGTMEPSAASAGPSRAEARQINLEICKVADKGNANALLNLVADRRHNMSCVNLSTAMHKLARLNKLVGVSLRASDPRVQSLHAQIEMELRRQLHGGPAVELQARSWSTIAWAYATLQMQGPDIARVFGVIDELAMAHLYEFKPIELANLMWSFAKLQMPCSRLFQQAQHRILNDLYSFTSANLSTIVWAFATVRNACFPFLQVLSNEFVHRLPTCEVNPVEIANLVWALASLKVRLKSGIFKQIGNRVVVLVSQFKLQELSITAWSFSRMAERHDKMFTAIAQMLFWSESVRQQIHAQGVANLLWAFERQKVLGSGVTELLEQAVCKLLPICLNLMEQFKPQEFACVFRALEKLSFTWGSCLEGDALLAAGASRGCALLNHFTTRQCVDLLDTFSALLNGSVVPDPSQEAYPVFEFLLGYLLQRCIDDLHTLGPQSPLRFVGFASVAISNFSGLHAKFSGIIAFVALQLQLGRLEVNDQMQLGVMCGLSAEDFSLPELQKRLTNQSFTASPSQLQRANLGLVNIGHVEEEIASSASNELADDDIDLSFAETQMQAEEQMKLQQDTDLTAACWAGLSASRSAYVVKNTFIDFEDGHQLESVRVRANRFSSLPSYAKTCDGDVEDERATGDTVCPRQNSPMPSDGDVKSDATFDMAAPMPLVEEPAPTGTLPMARSAYTVKNTFVEIEAEDEIDLLRIEAKSFLSLQPPALRAMVPTLQKDSMEEHEGDSLYFSLKNELSQPCFQ